MRGPVPVAADAHHCIALVAHAGIVQYGHLQELAASPWCSQECYMHLLYWINPHAMMYGILGHLALDALSRFV